jgi:hypothetical protein
MQYINTIFNQLLTFLPKNKFNEFVGQHSGDRYVKYLNSWNHLVLLLYAQASGKDSLRDIESGFEVNQNLWYHLGVKSVKRSSLSDANNRRDYRIFEKLFYELLRQCQEMAGSGRKFQFENPLYSFDSTTVNLCLGLFNWAKYRKTKGAIKIHVMLNNRTAIPELLTITDGKKSDLAIAKAINSETLEKGSIIVFDRAYIDYGWWQKLNRDGIFFVSRTKSRQNIFVIGQHNPNKLKGKVILADERVIFGAYGEKYHDILRRVRYYDKKTKREFEYLTNNFELNAEQIAFIYKERWQIELFFKWIKQNLKIKSFLGTSKNAVMSQIWTAMIYYLLLNYIRFQTKFKKSLLEFTRMIKETFLFRRNLIDLLSLDCKNVHKLATIDSPQLAFF